MDLAKCDQLTDKDAMGIDVDARISDRISRFFENRAVCVTGGAGFLGRCVVAKIERFGPERIIIPRSAEYDLTHESGVAALFQQQRIDIVIHLAAEVGGIGANARSPGRFFFANMAMGLHMVEQARIAGVEKFVQVGSVCSYPKHAPIPFQEADLWNGFPEETNAAYGVAKRALGAMIQAYRTQYGFPGVHVIPVNLYGPYDNFDPDASHVIPAIIQRFVHAVEKGERSVVCWGTGNVTREFLFVEDAAEAVVRAAALYDDPSPINVGSGHEITIAALAGMIARQFGFAGEILWDSSRPDGQPRRRLDVSRSKKLLDWGAEVSLDEGLEKTIRWYRQRRAGCKDEGREHASGTKPVGSAHDKLRRT